MLANYHMFDNFDCITYAVCSTFKSAQRLWICYAPDKQENCLKSFSSVTADKMFL